MFKLLMTCVGGELSPQTITFAKQMKQHDVQVIGIDANEKAQGRYFADHFYKAPLTESNEYIPFLQNLVEKHTVDLILPGSDEEALKIAEHSALFEKLDCQIACPAFETLKILSNKAETYKRLAAVDGVNIPIWEEHTSLDGLIAGAKHILEKCGGVVLKPAISRGGRDILVISEEYSSVQSVSNARELRMNLQTFLNEFKEFYAGKFPVIAMQRLVEPVYDVDMLSLNSRIFQIVPRRRVHSAAPNEGHIVVNDQKLIALAETVISEFNLSWLQDIDVMYDDKGDPYILEINPRPSGSFSISQCAGIPILENLICLAKKDFETYNRVTPSETKIVPYKALKADR